MTRPRGVLVAGSVASVVLVVATGAALAPDGARPWLTLGGIAAVVAAVQGAVSDPDDHVYALLFGLPPVLTLLADTSPTWPLGPLAALLWVAGELNALSWECEGRETMSDVARRRLKQVAGLAPLAAVVSLAIGAIPPSDAPGERLAIVVAALALAALGFVVFDAPRS